MRIRRNVIQALGMLSIGYCRREGIRKGSSPDRRSDPALGLPPLPPGIGPVEKFADLSATLQGKLLEGRRL